MPGDSEGSSDGRVNITRTILKQAATGQINLMVKGGGFMSPQRAYSELAKLNTVVYQGGGYNEYMGARYKGGVRKAPIYSQQAIEAAKKMHIKPEEYEKQDKATKAVMDAYVKGEIKSLIKKGSKWYANVPINNPLILQKVKKLGLQYVHGGGKPERVVGQKYFVERNGRWEAKTTVMASQEALKEAKVTDPNAHIMTDSSGVQWIETSNKQLASELVEKYDTPVKYSKADKGGYEYEYHPTYRMKAKKTLETMNEKNIEEGKKPFTWNEGVLEELTTSLKEKREPSIYEIDYDKVASLTTKKQVKERAKRVLEGKKKEFKKKGLEFTYDEGAVESVSNQLLSKNKKERANPKIGLIITGENEVVGVSPSSERFNKSIKEERGVKLVNLAKTNVKKIKEATLIDITLNEKSLGSKKYKSKKVTFESPLTKTNPLIEKAEKAGIKEKVEKAYSEKFVEPSFKLSAQNEAEALQFMSKGDTPHALMATAGAFTAGVAGGALSLPEFVGSLPTKVAGTSARFVREAEKIRKKEGMKGVGAYTGLIGATVISNQIKGFKEHPISTVGSFIGMGMVGEAIGAPLRKARLTKAKAEAVEINEAINAQLKKNIEVENLGLNLEKGKLKNPMFEGETGKLTWTEMQGSPKPEPTSLTPIPEPETKSTGWRHSLNKLVTKTKSKAEYKNVRVKSFGQFETVESSFYKPNEIFLPTLEKPRVFVEGGQYGSVTAGRQSEFVLIKKKNPFFKRVTSRKKYYYEPKFIDTDIIATDVGEFTGEIKAKGKLFEGSSYSTKNKGTFNEITAVSADLEDIYGKKAGTITLSKTKAMGVTKEAETTFFDFKKIDKDYYVGNWFEKIKGKRGKKKMRPFTFEEEKGAEQKGVGKEESEIFSGKKAVTKTKDKIKTKDVPSVVFTKINAENVISKQIIKPKDLVITSEFNKKGLVVLTKTKTGLKSIRRKKIEDRKKIKIKDISKTNLKHISIPSKDIFNKTGEITALAYSPNLKLKEQEAVLTKAKVVETPLTSYGSFPTSRFEAEIPKTPEDKILFLKSGKPRKETKIKISKEFKFKPMKKVYTPSITAVTLGITRSKKPSKKAIFSGLELRPMVGESKKNKKEVKKSGKKKKISKKRTKRWYRTKGKIRRMSKSKKEKNKKA